MVRIRSAYVSGTILNNPLAIGDTTLSSAALANLPAVASPDYAALILDPAGSAGNPEIVWVTAHTASATTATIARAKEGTTARQHLLAVAWAHGPTIMDFNQRKGADLTSASTLTIPDTDEDYFVVTGTTPVTALSSQAGGRRVRLRFSGACPITHNGTSLILLGGVSYTCTANDVLEFISEESGNWRQVVGPVAQLAAQQHITRVGYSTAEQTTTSTSAVDLLTISGLSIPVTNGFIVEGVVRKTSGAANRGNLGLKVNSTVVVDANSTGDHDLWNCSNVNQAESGFFRLEVGPRSTNYLWGIATGRQHYQALSAGATPVVDDIWATHDAAFPNATITSITIRGNVNNALVTLGLKEVAIFEVKYS